MKPTVRAKLFLVLWFLAGIVYEAYALLDRIPGDTISAAVWSWNDAHPDFKAGVGVAIFLLTIHFFFGWRRSKVPE